MREDLFSFIPEKRQSIRPEYVALDAMRRPE